MRVLVTGAAGFLGSHIARAVIAAGHSVRLLRRPSADTGLLDGLSAEQVEGDILAPASLAAAVLGIDAVVHAAAHMRGSGRLEDRIRSHVDGTQNLLSAAAQAGVRRFVYVSSVAALGIPDEPPAPSDADARPLDETHAWNAPPDLWPYGYAKFRAQELVRAATSMETVSLNPSVVLGAGDRHRVSNAIVWHIMHGRVPPILPGGVGVVHVEDVAEGALAALTRGRSGETYILNGENLRVEDLLTLVAEVVGVRPPRLRIPFGAARLLADGTDNLARWFRPQARPVLLQLAGRYFYFDNRKARRELGLDLGRTARAGVEDAAAWYRDHT
jgi:dihydroflavonol-4-reductase